MIQISRRSLLLGATTLVGATALMTAPNFAKNAFAQLAEPYSPSLPIPPLVTPQDGETVTLTMKKARHVFDPRMPQKTALSAGINADYLGPCVKLQNGQKINFKVENRLGEVTTLHWHGLFVPSMLDGGPHNLIEDGQDWNVELLINQPSSLNWFHPHVHQDTARQAHMGLAGLMIVDDGKDEERGLPHTYGMDDIPLILQDRRVIEGDAIYQTDMMDLMHGFRGDKLIVNGVINPTIDVPKGIVRLRLLNGANARIFTLSFSDNRPFHIIASDGGYISKPVETTKFAIAPGERYEILVDFSTSNQVMLQTAEFDEGNGELLSLMHFSTTNDKPVNVTAVPAKLDGPEKADVSLSGNKRDFFFDERMKENMQAVMKRAHGSHAMGGDHNMMEHMHHGGRSVSEIGTFMTAADSNMAMAIAGQTFDMKRIDVEAKLGSYEIWTLTADEMAHPFHIHGASFRVLVKDDQAPPAHESGWKDTVLIQKSAKLLIHFNRKAEKAAPFMFHCHMLEHEDLGMMAQFITV